MTAPRTRPSAIADAIAGAGPLDENSLEGALTAARDNVHDAPELAEQLALRCIEAADRLGVPAIAAPAHYLHARVLAERGALAEALAAIGRAREDWERAGETLLSLRTNLGRMQVLDDLGRHGEAVEVGQALLAALDRTDSDVDERLRDELRATAWNNIGVAHSFRGDHDATIDAYAAAEAGYERLTLTSEAAKTRANRGIELLEVGRAREALVALHEARQSFADTGDRMWAAKCRGNVAQAHAQLGATMAALDELALARATLDQLRADAESARLRVTGARLYLMAGMPREAFGEAQQAVQFLRSAAMAHDAANAALTCALACLAIGRTADAAPWLLEATQLFGEVGDRQSQAEVTLAEAAAADLRGAREEAFALAGAAADAFRAGGWLVLLARAYLRLVDLAPDQSTADRWLDTAAELVAELRLPDLRYAFCLRAARARAADDPATAERLLREAIEIVDGWGAALSSAELRTAFRDDHLAAHDLLVDVLVTRGTPDAVAEAAELADRAKAGTLRDFGVGALGNRWRAAGEQEDATVSRLRGDLSSTYHAMHETTDRRLYAALQQRATDLERELTLASVEASTRTGPAADTARAEPALAATALPVISYHLVGDDLLTFAGAGGAPIVHRMVGARPLLEMGLGRLNAQWSRFALGADFVRRHESTLAATTIAVTRDLYELLLAPVRDFIDASGSAELVLAPHRNLHQVPFAALHDGTQFVGERWAITLAPTALGAGAAVPVPEHAEVVLFAAPDDATPAIAREADTVCAAWPRSRSYIGTAATSDALRTATAGAAVIHIACHGRYRESNPMFSALRLADRWVTASEVLEADVEDALVVLSACETGRHATSSAEPVGLAWAFLAAGASGAVVSQWLVDDGATAELMAGFYRGLGAGLSPPRALQAAQRAVAARSPHPYFWSAFSYVARPPARPVRRVPNGTEASLTGAPSRGPSGERR